jgi:mercuric ion transport protein
MVTAAMNIRDKESRVAETSRLVPDERGTATLRLTMIGGIVGAVASSACCIAPLVLFSLGISGAWIGNLTALAPYQPYFIVATLACLGYGYWLVLSWQKVRLCRRRRLCPPAAQLYRQGDPRPGDASPWRRDWLGPARTLFL